MTFRRGGSIVVKDNSNVVDANATTLNYANASVETQQPTPGVVDVYPFPNWINVGGDFTVTSERSGCFLVDTSGAVVTITIVPAVLLGETHIFKRLPGSANDLIISIDQGGGLSTIQQLGDATSFLTSLVVPATIDCVQITYNLTAQWLITGTGVQPQGLQGDPGPQGDPGIQGDPGPPGASVGIGAFGARPAAGNAGALYMPTDAPFMAIDDGTAWRPLLDGVLGTEPPAAAVFTGVRTLGALDEFATRDNVLVLRAEAPGSVAEGQLKNIPSFLAWSAEFQVKLNVSGSGVAGAGIAAWWHAVDDFMVETGYVVAFLFVEDTATNTRYAKVVSFSDPDGTAVVSDVNYSIASAEQFLRVRVATGTVYFEASRDRIYWRTLFTDDAFVVWSATLPSAYGPVVYAGTPIHAIFPHIILT